MVYVEQIYTKCVAEAAYLIVSNGEAVIIDPLRETAPYLEKLANFQPEDGKGEKGAKLKYVFETHFHADFVSGHQELRAETGAPIVFGPTANPGFEAVIATDGQVFTVGGATLTVIHTPGHTMESSCFLLHDEEGKKKCMFTGDTLFVGDVGRPDLAQKAANMTMEQLAGLLFHSLRNKVMVHEDELVVYPGHGAGSACGKSLSTQTWDTLGNQKAKNYALRADMTEAEFVTELTADLPPPPTYFPASVGKNKEKINVAGAAKILSVEEFEAAMNLEANKSRVFPTKEAAEKCGLDYDASTAVLVLDCRHSLEFMKAHIKGSVFAGLTEGNMGPWVASAIGDLNRPYLMVTDPSEHAAEQFELRLRRFGFDHPLGILTGSGIDAWVASGRAVTSITNVSPEDLAQAVEDAKPPGVHIVDCRKPGEHKSKHHMNSYNVPLDAANLHQIDFASGVTPHVHCEGAYRSVIMCSLMMHCCPQQVEKIGGVLNIAGGFEKMRLNDQLAAKMQMSACRRAAAEAAAKKKAEEESK